MGSRGLSGAEPSRPPAGRIVPPGRCPHTKVCAWGGYADSARSRWLVPRAQNGGGERRGRHGNPPLPPWGTLRLSLLEGASLAPLSRCPSWSFSLGRRMSPPGREWGALGVDPLRPFSRIPARPGEARLPRGHCAAHCAAPRRLWAAAVPSPPPPSPARGRISPFVPLYPFPS